MLTALRSHLVGYFLCLELSILCWHLSADGVAGNDKCNMLQSKEMAVQPAIENERVLGVTSPAEGGHTSLEQLGKPSMFVAIVNARNANRTNRDTLRVMWQHVDGGKDYMCTRHVFCKSDTDGLQSALDDEAATHGDMVFLNCAEGYGEGLLTKKVIAAMQLFRESKQDACMNRPLFMKIDSDTFVAKRFVQTVEKAWHQFGENMYAGMVSTFNDPPRDPSSQWYEPYSVFPDRCYPPTIVGGPGYILGRKTIDLFFEHRLVETVLHNEDRAVAHWVAQTKLLTANPIKMVSIEATNGYSGSQQVTSGLYWTEYPYFLVHKATGERLSCLVEIDSRENPSDVVDDCFSLERKRTLMDTTQHSAVLVRRQALAQRFPTTNCPIYDSIEFISLP